MSILFGPAGKCNLAESEKLKSTEQLIRWLAAKGATAFEYQCGRGVNIGREKAEQLGKVAAECGIALSIHAPYYISLASAEEEKRHNSVRYILDSARAARYMGASRIVVHPGGLGKLTREEATALACETLREAFDALDAEGLSDIHPCLEVMGKINQLGTVEEVLQFCQLDERLLPCVDFGHLNSRTHGSLNGYEAYDAVFGQIANAIGEERMRKIHVHFSKIEYSKGGEVRHLTFEDTQFGPDYQPMLECMVKYGFCGVIICESNGTQTQDALTMQQYYRSLEV